MSAPTLTQTQRFLWRLAKAEVSEVCLVIAQPETVHPTPFVTDVVTAFGLPASGMDSFFGASETTPAQHRVRAVQSLARAGGLTWLSRCTPELGALFCVSLAGESSRSLDEFLREAWRSRRSLARLGPPRCADSATSALLRDLARAGLASSGPERVRAEAAADAYGVLRLAIDFGAAAAVSMAEKLYCERTPDTGLSAFAVLDREPALVRAVEAVRTGAVTNEREALDAAVTIGDEAMIAWLQNDQCFAVSAAEPRREHYSLQVVSCNARPLGTPRPSRSPRDRLCVVRTVRRTA